MSWRLNTFLTTFREAVNKKFPKRDKASDGTIGDTRHQAESFSEHNPDPDGSVDAWDMDLNLTGASNYRGSAAEKEDVEALKKEFQKQPQAQLWIHNRQIANRDIGNWARRHYGGSNPHDHHIHWQSRSSRETQPYHGDLVVDAINAPEPKPQPGNKAPAWPFGPNDYYRRLNHPVYRAGLAAAQAQLKRRGWKIGVDGLFGAQTETVIKAFQKEKGIKADGLLGPKTWRLIWEAPTN
jgi:peptidoglycan hydrolase-like protein with peptidoglycan-binding domain